MALVEEGSARAAGAAPPKSVDAREPEEVRDYNERADVAPPEGFGSLADKLRGALKAWDK